MANSFSEGMKVVVTEEDVRRMTRIAPDLITLTTQEEHHDEFSDQPPHLNLLEMVAFPHIPQCSKRGTAKRMKYFTDALQRIPSSAAVEKKTLQIRKSSVSTPSYEQEDEQNSGRTANAFPTLEENLHASEPSINGATNDSQRTNEYLMSPYLSLLCNMDIYREQIVHIERRTAREAQYCSFELLGLPTQVVQALNKQGIHQLYSHQYKSISATMRGENVVLSTSTASGKSLTYNLPSLSALISNTRSTCLYLFPTKALAQDQLKSLRRLLTATGLPEHLCATFDGDTPMPARGKLIRETDIFLTNPDTLHLTILPKHVQWKRVLATLTLVVVDEAHMYHGVFGSHVANVFRRLFRLCALYGSNPRVICCTATIRNPEAHFRMLIPTLPNRRTRIDPPFHSAQLDGITQLEDGPASFDFFYRRPLRVITGDGAPCGEKEFCVWNPIAKTRTETLDIEATTLSAELLKVSTRGQKRKREKGLDEKVVVTVENTIDDITLSATIDKHRDSTSTIFQSAQILSRFVEEGIHTLLFCKGRKLAELVLMSVHSVLGAKSSTRPLRQRVQSYRGGYSRDNRREIEQRLFTGELLGIIATNALELGIDIGDLDCTMHLGLPTTVSSLWQQAGRAGRKHTQSSIAIIVCFNSPLDQHFARHPKELFTLQPEAVILNADNPKILAPHVLNAAHEYALYDSRSGLSYIDSIIYGTERKNELLLEALVQQKQLLRRTVVVGGGYTTNSCGSKKARTVNLRGISDIVCTVMTDDSTPLVLDTIPGDTMYFQVYPTAVYLHQAQEYIITHLDLDKKLAYAHRCAQLLTYFTVCRDYTFVEVIKVQRRRQLIQHALMLSVCEGQVAVTTLVFGSTKIEKRSMKVLDVNEFTLPPMQSFGHAVWFELPRECRTRVGIAASAWLGALHGVGHLLLAVIPLFIMCDNGDLNTEHYNRPRDVHEKQEFSNRITIFERRDGGTGVVDQVVHELPSIVEKARIIAQECPCVTGCPSCIQSAQCTEYNQYLNKDASMKLLNYLHTCINESWK